MSHPSLESVGWSARRGTTGEHRVATVLDAFAPEVQALHDRLIAPGRSQVDLDHVVVTHAGVFVLDTRSWTADLTVHHGMLWRHVGPPHERHHTPQDRTLATVADHADLMAEALHVPVHPVLVLAHECHRDFEPQEVAGVHVVPAGRLGEWLMRRPVVLTDAQCEALLAECGHRFPDADAFRGPDLLGDGSGRRPVAPGWSGARPASAPWRPELAPERSPAGRRTDGVDGTAGRWVTAVGSLAVGVVALTHVQTVGSWVGALAAQVLGTGH